jgi:hypothetical protein
MAFSFNETTTRELLGSNLHVMNMASTEQETEVILPATAGGLACALGSKSRIPWWPIRFCGAGASRYLGAAAGAAPGAAACGLRAGAGLVPGAGAATAGFGFTDGSSVLMAESGKRVQYWFLPSSEMPI